MMPRDTVVTFPDRTNRLRAAASSLRRKGTESKVLSGGIIMLLATTLVSALNFAYNVVMARMLGPSRFGHVTASVTLLMLASAVTLAFQLVCAKFVARNRAAGAKAGVYRSLRGKAWLVSLALGGALVLAQKPMANYLRFPDPHVLVVLAVGLATYVPLGVRRGAMQGLYSFRRLSGSFIVEALTRFVTGVVLVLAGYGVFGAVGAISASVLAAYFFPPLGKELKAQTESGDPASFDEGIQAIVFFIGQVIICNVDVLLVKHFFAPEIAGLYAAVALVGRLLYFASWSVVSAMFPVSAAQPQEENRHVTFVPLLAVVALSGLFILALSLFPHLIIHTVFGVEFHQGESLLPLYAAATGLYSLSVVLIAYEMSRRIAITGWLQLIFSGVLVLGIGLFHNTLREVIVVQITLMSVLLLLVSFPFLRRRRLPLHQEAV